METIKNMAKNMAKNAAYTFVFLTALWWAYEKGEEAYWTEVAGCPCNSCIEAAQDEQLAHEEELLEAFIEEEKKRKR